MNWFALIIAGFFEIGWAVGLKYTEGFTKIIPIFTGTAMAVSFLLLSYALRTIPLGTGYAIWTGIGACGTLLFGMFFFGDRGIQFGLAAILAIIACIIILKMIHE